MGLESAAENTFSDYRVYHRRGCSHRRDLVWYAQATYGSAPVVAGVVVQDLVKEGMHTPVIEYRTPEGARERFKSRLGSYPQKYFVGDKVEVLLVGAERKPMLKDWFGMYGVALGPLERGICRWH